MTDKKEELQKMIDYIREKIETMQSGEYLAITRVGNNGMVSYHSQSGQHKDASMFEFDPPPPPIPPDMTPVWVARAEDSLWKGPYVSSGKITPQNKLMTYYGVDDFQAWNLWTTEDPRNSMDSDSE